MPSPAPPSSPPGPAAAHTRLWQRLHRRYGDLLHHLPPGPPIRASMQACLEQLLARELELSAALRILRQLVVQRLMTLDCDGAASLHDVTRGMSELAELTLDHASQYANATLQEHHGLPLGPDGQPVPLWIIGMGKLGARELNVSSDIDLIYVYEHEGETTGRPDSGGQGRISHHEYFTRAVKIISALIAEVTEHGFVFRVDLALRPHGNSGPTALALPALANYLLTHGREWERFAWLKSRVVAPLSSVRSHNVAALRTVVLPFVFRRYLDYGVFDALRELHRQIREHASRRSAGRPERANDVKLSRGGIREIEFTVQLLQVVRGGQYPELRCRPTLEALQRLARAALMPTATTEQLGRAYTFLRNVEHRIQYLDDQQTHALPTRDDDLAWIARTMGYADTAAFLHQLNVWRELVAQEFDALLGDNANHTCTSGLCHLARPEHTSSTPTPTPTPTLRPALHAASAPTSPPPHPAAGGHPSTATHPLPGTAPPEAISTIAPPGPPPGTPRPPSPGHPAIQPINELSTLIALLPEPLAQRVALWQDSPKFQALRPITRTRLLRLVQHTARSMAAATSTVTTAPLPGTPGLAAPASSAVSELAALRFIDWLEPLMRREAYLALLLERPIVHQRLLHLLGAAAWPARYLQQHPGVIDELASEQLLGERFDPTIFERDMALRLRALQRTGEDDDENLLNLLRRAHHAETFRTLARDVEGAITVEQVADDLSALADSLLRLTTRWCWQRLRQRHCDEPRFAIIGYGKLGGKELGYGSDLDIVFLFDDNDERAPDIYAAFVRKLINWLTVKTGEGDLFEIDTALRPNGNSGLLVTSFTAYARYQQQRGSNTAWTWEHQAMTRARFVLGNPDLQPRFDAVRDNVITAPRERAALRREIIHMRERMRAAHPPRGQGFDIKHGTGGMVDVEFAVQYLVLAHSGQHPALRGNLGNITLLQHAEAAGLLPAGIGQAAATAYRQLRRIQHTARLNESRAPANPLTLAPQRQAVTALWEAVFGPVVEPLHPPSAPTAP